MQDAVKLAIEYEKMRRVTKSFAESVEKCGKLLNVDTVLSCRDKK